MREICDSGRDGSKTGLSERDGIGEEGCPGLGIDWEM